ncbi:MAG: 2-oxoacid:ferredoxin oxidoreductase subunit gamma [Clostridia bacterium]|nr:2-oxoacid:ferredoxin oxidoreductase subunit gamma [Clostridia bacterium]
MHHEIIIAGFGGQGILFAGQLLTHAGMVEGKHVSWIPSYGPEMRGGTANCSVVISDRGISSPIVTEPTILMAFNGPSLEKFENRIKPEGFIFYNSSIIKRDPQNPKASSYGVPVNEMAEGLGNSKVANMVMLGALIEITKIVSPETLLLSLEKALGRRKKNMLSLNEEALKAGREYAVQRLK